MLRRSQAHLRRRAKRLQAFGFVCVIEQMALPPKIEAG
jgi:hypothetical protein